jgi:hypothetical protein
MMKALTRAAAFGLMAAAVVGSVALLPGRGAAVSLHKAVLAGGQLYAVQVAGSTGAAADAIGLQVSGADVRRMVLPTQLSPPALTVPWDITSSAWFLVAFIDIVPGQRSCQLAKVGLSDLGPSGAMPPTPASRVPRFSDLITHVPPLSMAVAAAQAQGAGPVFADIVVLGDKQVELYIAAGKTMSMFEYGGAAWSGKWRVPRESAAPFVAVRSGETTYLVTEQGTISTRCRRWRRSRGGVRRMVPVR